MKRRDFLGAAAGIWGLPPLGWFQAPSAAPPSRKEAAGERFVERWSWAMGQAVHLQLFAASEAEGNEAAAAALAELRRIEARLSLFDDASDLMELNRRAGRGAMRLDHDLHAVLALAERYRDLSGGAFNVAVEPLMRAWGFHRPRTGPPTTGEIAEAREAVATAVIRLDADRATLPAPHTQLDLGGIGVGYGLDRAGAVLRARGIQRALLDVSGDCLALGAPPGEEGWLVGIAAPAPSPDRPGALSATVRLRDQALATSSNLVSVIRFGAALRGHVMDPDTGYPATGLRQVSVVARTGVGADALSTAMLVSGRRGAEVLWCYQY
ncbi:MAG: FAD:protein FMN transferase [Gemmatimonadales bacterium]